MEATSNPARLWQLLEQAGVNLHEDGDSCRAVAETPEEPCEEFDGRPFHVCYRPPGHLRLTTPFTTSMHKCRCSYKWEP